MIFPSDFNADLNAAFFMTSPGTASFLFPVPRAIQLDNSSSKPLTQYSF